MCCDMRYSELMKVRYQFRIYPTPGQQANLGFSIKQGIGVDLGLETLAILSTGEKVKAPHTSALDRKIRRGKRKLARAVKGSKP